MYTYWNISAKKIDVDFGEVEAGTTAVQLLNIFNESCIEQYYEARRDAITNPLDHVFELCKYSWTLSPHQIYKCKVYYRPFVPFSVNIDYFTIMDSTGVCTNITVYGTCIDRLDVTRIIIHVGPVLSSSVTRLVMICASENSETKKRIKLVNDSKATATFMFDIDRIQRSFRLDMKHGHIGPRSCKYVTMTFAPRDVGIYACHLPCLVLNHKPIIIELYGYCGPISLKANIQNRFVYPTRLESGFEGYMSDIIIAAHNLPAISSSKNYIDFGQASVGTGNMQKIPEALCLTNHSQFDILITWEQDDEEIFIVTPAIAKIPMTQTALFEVVFNPNKESDLFARELRAYIFTEQIEDHEEALTLPMIVSVRLIGHSFPVCSDGWIPQYEIPHIIKMPPCVPSCPVYTTFLIKKFGNLPLMYHFVPPPASHFIVKPMMGIIYDDYQIIVVGMLPGTEDQRIYVERWVIHFNGNLKSEYFIDFRGFAEFGNVSFNNQNIVTSVPTFPGCQQLQQFSMRNITRHSIKYKFLEVSSEFRIRKVIGEMHSNDIITHDWEFNPTIIGDCEFQIDCVLNVLKDEISIGPDICVKLFTIGRCEIGFLVSAPDELNFGIQAYKIRKEMSFYVFNLSPVNIHYKMICCHYNWPIKNIEHDVKLHPSTDTIYAGQNKMITVSVTPNMPGYHEFFIQYLVRTNSHTDILVSDQAPRNICKLHYLCVLPSLKVKDLQCYGSSPVMNKAFLWKLMKINILNKLLKDLQPETSETLYLNFPPMILNENPVIIKLFLTNITEVIASWNIKRVQLCSCRPVAKTESFSFRYMKHECVHRNVCSLQPKRGNIKLGEEVSLTLELRYTLLGNTAVKWDLDLGDNRHIFLIMTIEALSGSENKLHVLNDLHFKFQHIYFGNKKPVYQICWMYNGTNNSVPFSVNTKMIQEIDQTHCPEVFSCATPHGIVNPQSFVPILLKFQPRQFGIFKGRLFLMLGDEKKILALEAESSLPYKVETIGEYVSPNCSSKLNDIPIYCNTDCIDIPYIAIHNHLVKMFMMHNNLEHDILSYEWERHEIPGIIYVEIHPQKGLIKPMTTQSFCVTVNTGGYPCVIDVNISCKFINTSQRRKYQRSVYKHKILSDELKGQFTITEKGVSIPKPWIKMLTKPQPFYKTITIRCCIYSPEDTSLKIDLMKELISAPSVEISIKKSERQIIFSKEDINLSSFILEGILWDIVNSRSFKNSMQDILRHELNLTYPQFTMNLHERKRLIRRSYISSPRTLINSILEKMLFVMIHEEFALETVHSIQQTDIRHIRGQIS